MDDRELGWLVGKQMSRGGGGRRRGGKRLWMDGGGGDGRKTEA